MKLSSGFDRTKARVELTPLLDVMFLLLIFFIYSTLSLTAARGIEVDLPQTSPSSLLEKVRTPLVVTYTADGQCYLDEVPFPEADLPFEVIRRWRERPVAVLVNGDRRAPLGPALELLATLRKAGIEKVAFRLQSPSRR